MRQNPLVDARFTPTGVGTMTETYRRRPRRAVHPHGRGDNFPSFILGVCNFGSPPRAWGQCARSALCLGDYSVHPHGRGDNRSTRTVMSMTPGSPPRAWGQCHIGEVVEKLRRFTPTGVGTIRMCCLKLTLRAVHPHGRGDNDDYYLVAIRRNGSPPRAWGQSFG